MEINKINSYNNYSTHNGFCHRKYNNTFNNVQYYVYNGKRVGLFKYHNSDGKLHNKGFYLNDNLIGYMETYHSHGELCYRCNCICNENAQLIYKNNKRFGEMITWRH